MEPNNHDDSMPPITEQFAALDLASLEDLLDAVLIELTFRTGPAWFANPATWN